MKESKTKYQKIGNIFHILAVLNFQKRYPDPKKELPVRKNTLLNSEVILIDYLNSTEGPPAIVSTKNGLMVPADHVIVTVSLGVLKEQHNFLFMPPLPDFKVKTIEVLLVTCIYKLKNKCRSIMITF